MYCLHACPSELAVYCLHAGMDTRGLAATVASAVEQAVARHKGDVLVFLPGMREIRAAHGQLVAQRSLPGNAEVFSLHGNLPLEAQDALLVPAPAGMEWDQQTLMLQDAMWHATSRPHLLSLSRCLRGLARQDASLGITMHQLQAVV